MFNSFIVKYLFLLKIVYNTIVEVVNMNQELFAIRLKKLRESMHLTQNQFGALLNIAQTTLSSYEKGSKTPNIDTLCNIAEKCNVSIDWLCGRTDLKNVEHFNTYSEVFQAIVKVCKNVKFSII